MAQARAALNKYKDVMQAAERIFDGSFDHVLDDDGDVEMASGEPAPPQRQPRMIVRSSQYSVLSCVLTDTTRHQMMMRTSAMLLKRTTRTMVSGSLHVLWCDPQDEVSRGGLRRLRLGCWCKNGTGDGDG